MLRTIFLITFIFASNAFASDESRVWFYQSFPDVTAVMASDTNPQGVIYELCRAKSNTNLTNATQPSYADGDTAFGHYTAGVASTNQVNGNTWQCVYGSATPEDDNLYYLYVYAEEPCDEGSTYDREKRACIKPKCVSGEKNLLSGISYPLIGSNGSAYIADQTPESVCAKTPDSSSSCTYNKPAFSHSCYADSPLSWDDGNLSGSYTGHCNYQFVNSGKECKLTSNTLPTAWGGYSLNSSDQSGDMTCADGITSPGCPTDGGNGGNGGSGGTGGDGGSGGTGGDGNGGTGGDGGGGTGGNGGTGGDGNGNGGSVSGTACGAALACTGDAIQCAILAQQKKSSCALEKFTATDDSAASSMLTGEKFQLDERTIEATSFFERTRFLTESCPAPVVFSLSFGTFDFDFDLICDFAHILSNLIVLGATLLALMIVFKD